MADPGQSSDVHSTSTSGEGGTVEIKIKTLDAQSYSLRVDKNTPVPALKDQIASVVGVPVENQRLICRGKVLKDDQVLAAYNVEDGHTLHLVARQPPQASATSGQEQAAGTASPSDMVVISPRTGPHLSHSVLMGTINIPDAAEGGMLDLNRIISAVLSSVGIGNAVPAPGGSGSGGSVAVGVLPSRAQDGQPRAGSADATSAEGPLLGEHDESIDDIEAQLQLDAIYGVHAPDIFAGTGPALPFNPFHMMQSSPMVVPDALATMSQYLDRLEQSFSIFEGAGGHNVQGPGTSDGATRLQGNRPVGQTSEARVGPRANSGAPSSSTVPSLQQSSDVAVGSGRQGTGGTGTSGPVAPPRRLPTPSTLGTIVNRVQSLLNGQGRSALSRLAAQLEYEPNVNDPLARDELQRIALHDGSMMQHLGALLLELGRTTLTMRLGQSPADSVVNGGPAVFISPLGPNPMMVQSLPSQAGVALGALPSGPPQAGGGHVGPSLGPRIINVHIHTSDLRLPSASPSGTPPPQQPPPRAVIGLTSGAPSLAVRQMVEHGDGAANPEHALRVRQIIERAEADNGGPQRTMESNSHTASIGAVQGAIMTFNENGAMRVVPVRTRAAAVPGAPHRHVVNDGDAILPPLIARFQQHLGSPQHGRPGSTTTAELGSPFSHLPGAAPAGEHPAPVPSVRAQVHIQAWAPSMHPVGGVPSQHGSGSAPNSEFPLPPVTGRGTDGTAESPRDGTVPAPARPLSDGPAVQPAEGVAQGVDVTQILDSLGPLLNQLAVVFNQARPQPPNQRLSQQAMEQHPSASQPNVESSVANAPVASVPVNVNEASEGDLAAPVAGPGGRPARGPDIKSDDPMDTTDETKIAVGHADPGPGNDSTSAGLVEEHTDVDRTPRNAPAVEAQVEEPDQPASPIGLGVGGLQPLLPRSRRRPPPNPRQVQTGDVGAAAATGNELQPSVMEQALSGTRQNLLQNLSTGTCRSSHRPEHSLREQSLGQVSEGLLPLVGRVRSEGSAPESSLSGEGTRELGDFMGQLMSRSSEGTASGQGALLGDMLRGVMGQLVQSPVMENLAQQVTTGMRNGDTPDTLDTLVGLANRGQGNTPGFDFSSIVNQILPVMSQMFGSRPPSAGQQVPSSGSVRSHHEDGAARDSPGPISDSGRWREALNEEEATSWSETISADMEQQQTMEPQRPFSDVYVRGSPLAKRQKVDDSNIFLTELEGATAQKLENGDSPEAIMRSLPEVELPPYVEENYAGSTNSDGVSHPGQQGAVDGMADVSGS